MLWFLLPKFARTRLPQLGNLADTRLKIHLWGNARHQYGASAYFGNSISGLSVAVDMNWYGKMKFAIQVSENITIGELGVVGTAVSVDNFSYVLVYNAGLAVPFYQPIVSLEFLKQVIAMEPIHST
ncbi:hypothetical protein FRB95_007811 [Tulasnella sp. JGI-2019a]|nr:hypothetical protein FRB95_007811 [Tulasnella sp. JGI-2019a]